MRALLLVLIAAGCQGKAASPGPSAAGSGSAQGSAAALVSDAAAPTGDIPLVPFKSSLEGIEVVERGAEPRVPLHYRYVAGTTVTMTFEVDFDRQGPTGTGPLPTLVVALATEVKSVDASGTATLESKITKVDVRARPGAVVPAGSVAAQGALLTGAIVTTVVTTDGKTLDAKVALPARDMTAALVEAAAKQLEQYQELAMPLPGEPLGIGGRWRYTKRIKPMGSDVLATTTVTVTAIAGSHVTYSSTTTMTSPDTKFASGSANLDVQLQHFRGEGSGHGVLSLADPASTGETTLKLTFDLVADGMTSNIAMAAVTRALPGAQGEHNAP